SSTSQITAQSTSGLRKKHSRSPRPMPPEPMSPRRILSLAPTEPALAGTLRSETQLPASAGTRLTAKPERFRNWRRVRAAAFGEVDNILAKVARRTEVSRVRSVYSWARAGSKESRGCACVREPLGQSAAVETGLG